MAHENRTATDNLGFFQELREKPYNFDFFQLLRRLECIHKDKPKLGHAEKPKGEPIRLAQDPALFFAPSSIASYNFGKNGLPPKLAVYFFGLFGANGPLPTHISEFVNERKKKDDTTFTGFVDIFHHRFLTLFYRAFADTQPANSLDRPQDDKFAFYVNSLIGISSSSQQNRSIVNDDFRRFFAGVFSNQTRHPEGLKALLEKFFFVPVEIEEFVGHWLDIPKESGWRLGEGEETGILGKTVLLGSKVWDRQTKFRIIIGPVSLLHFERFLPGKESLNRLTSIVREYISDQLEWDLKLVLKNEENPSVRLGVTGALGWTTWLGKKSQTEKVSELILNPFKKGILH